MSLSDRIVEKIRQYGPISFRDFMDMALYYPELGYYCRPEKEIGKKGDFYTGSSVCSVFGEMVGRQLEEIWHILGKQEFTIVEMGAGTGMLSLDVLEYLGKNEELFSCLDYGIVEKSAAMREKQKKHLHGNVQWYDSLTDLQGMTGCIFSNELVDAFPVHQVVMGNELSEVFVDYDGGFVETMRPASHELKDYLNELGVRLPQGYRTEINLDALSWMHDINENLNKGFVITIDYGYPSEELYQEYRSSGTLMCYYRHTSNDNPYQRIGEQDITSLVNFSALSHWGKKMGLELCGFTDLAHFLFGLGIEEYLKKAQESEPKTYRKKMLPVKTLVMEMGELFKVIVQKKNIPCRELSCLTFPSRWRL